MAVIVDDVVQEAMMTEAYEHTTDFEEDCKSGPIVPVNCDSCRVRKDHEAELSRYRAFVGELKRWIQEQRVYGTTNPPKEVWKDKPFWLVAAELNNMLHDHIGEQE